MSEPSPAIVGLGEPLVEFNCVHAEEPQTYLQGFGGDTSNMVIAAARLGASTGYITGVGDDPFGRMFLKLWETEGVDTCGVAIDSAAPTGVYFVTHGVHGHEFSYLRAGSAAGRLAPERLPLVAACHAAGAPVVVLKRGSDGCVVSDGTRREHIPGHVVRNVDATGAGDCFDGAFAARIVAGDDPFAAAHYANAAAALATKGFGAVAPLPRDAGVRALLARGS